MNDRKEDFAMDIDEVGELFFGSDDKKQLDFYNGRPKKDDESLNKNTEKIKKAPKKNKTKEQKQKEAWEKEARFLKRFEEKLRKREEAEKNQKIEKSKKKKIKLKLKQKKEINKRKKLDVPKTLMSIGADFCTHHNDSVERILDGKIITTCTKCSRTKIWSMSDWAHFISDDVTKLKNPNEMIFFI